MPKITTVLLKMAAKLYLKDIIDNKRNYLAQHFLFSFQLYFNAVYKNQPWAVLQQTWMNYMALSKIVWGRWRHTTNILMLATSTLESARIVIHYSPLLLRHYAPQWVTSGWSMPRTQAPPGSNKISKAYSKCLWTWMQQQMGKLSTEL